jgi:hypothetical protein
VRRKGLKAVKTVQKRGASKSAREPMGGGQRKGGGPSETRPQFRSSVERQTSSGSGTQNGTYPNAEQEMWRGTRQYVGEGVVGLPPPPTTTQRQQGHAVRGSGRNIQKRTVCYVTVFGCVCVYFGRAIRVG